MEDIIFKKEDLVNNCKTLINKDYPLVSNLATISVLLANSLANISWAGFYLVNEKDKCLYVGPYQGGLGCLKIPFNNGVCGACYTLKEAILVPDVNKFKGHIACSSLTKSELVVPIIKDSKVKAVIDLDSEILANFKEDDKKIVSQIANYLSELF